MKHHEHGFTFVEILVALVVFSIVVIGALGVLGATSAGGLGSAFPTALVTTRGAKDTTAASVFAQAFLEFASSRSLATTADGVYCAGAECAGVSLDTAVDLQGHPMPDAAPYQLNWRLLEVTVNRWYWDSINDKYSPSAAPTDDLLVEVRVKMKWLLREQERKLEVARFIPYRPEVPPP